MTTLRRRMMSQIDGWHSEQYCQKSFVQCVDKYRKQINPDVKIYVFDLSGYGKLVLPERDQSAVVVGGFSDRIFQLMKLHENNSWNFLDVLNFLKLKISTSVN